MFVPRDGAAWPRGWRGAKLSANQRPVLSGVITLGQSEPSILVSITGSQSQSASGSEHTLEAAVTVRNIRKLKYIKVIKY